LVFKESASEARVKIRREGTDAYGQILFESACALASIRFVPHRMHSSIACACCDRVSCVLMCMDSEVSCCFGRGTLLLFNEYCDSIDCHSRRRSASHTATAAAGRLRAACCLLLAAARCLLLAAARCYLLLLLARCDLLLLLAKSKSNRVQSRREEAHNCLQSPNPTDLGRREEAHTCTLSLNRLRALIDTNWRGATKTGDVPQTQTALGHRSPSGTDRPRALSFDRPRALSIPIPYLSPTRLLI
jgi:hypothetical protein